MIHDLATALHLLHIAARIGAVVLGLAAGITTVAALIWLRRLLAGL